MSTLEQFDARLTLISSLSHDELVSLAAEVHEYLHSTDSDLKQAIKERDTAQANVREGLEYFRRKLVHPGNAWILRQLDHAFTVGVPASTDESVAISAGPGRAANEAVAA